MTNTDTTPAKISRFQAAIAKLPRYFTGEPCPHGHIAERYTGAGNCCECKRLREANRRAKLMAKDPAALRAYVSASVKRHYDKHRFEILASKKTYYAANRESITKALRERRRAAKEQHQGSTTPTQGN